MKNFIIPKPCHEDWDSMSAHEKGKFCTSCQTKVYDLTQSTSKEIHRIYELENGKVCGRIQLRSEINYSLLQRRVFQLEYFTQKYFSKFGAVISVLSFIMILTGCDKKKIETGASNYSQPDSTGSKPEDSSDYFPMAKIASQKSDTANYQDKTTKPPISGMVQYTSDTLHPKQKVKRPAKIKKVKVVEPPIFITGEIAIDDQE